MKTLIVNAHPFPDNEAHFSQKLLKGFLAKYDAKFARADLDILNLYEEDLPRIDQDLLSFWGAQMSGQELTADQQALAARQGRYLELFKAAKRVVVVFPMHNFNLPSRLKDFIDNVMVVGQTFKYTANGPAGLLTDDHRLLLLSASGSIYTNNDQYTAFEFPHQYLKKVLTEIMGFSSCAAVRAQGTAFLPADQVMAEANRQLDAEFEAFYTSNPTRGRTVMTSYKLVMPEDLNHYGFLFGGKMLMWVDEVAWMAVSSDYPGKHFVTVGMSEVTFRKSVLPKSMLRFVVERKRVGNTSVTYHTDVFRRQIDSREEEHVFHTDITFLRVDGAGNKLRVEV